MSTRTIGIGVVAILLLLVAAVWAMMRNGTDPQVEKVKQMQAEAFKQGATPEQRRQNFELVRQEMDKLSPEQRRDVGQQMRESFQRRMDQQIAAYFALPKDQRTAFLDKQIKEMEQRRKEMEARRAQRNQSNPQGSGGGQGGPGGQQAGGGQGGPGQQGGPQNRSTDERMQRRDQRLDNTTAEQRAMRSAYSADMRQRRIQLGLPASPFPSRGPR